MEKDRVLTQEHNIKQKTGCSEPHMPVKTPPLCTISKHVLKATKHVQKMKHVPSQTGDAEPMGSTQENELLQAGKNELKANLHQERYC